MRLLILANDWVGWQVTKYLREQKENIVGLVIHPHGKRRRYADKIIRESKLPSSFIIASSKLHKKRYFQQITSWKPDIIISAFYGFIIHPTVINIAPLGAINIHNSFLPYNRGKFPNVWAIVDETPIGATIHYINENIDSGDIIYRKKVEIEPIDTGKSLYYKVRVACVEAFKEIWPYIKTGKFTRTPQSKFGKGTFHYKKDVEKIDCISMNKYYKAKDLINLLRARTFPPYPSAYFIHNGRRIYVRVSLSYGDKTK